MSVAKLRSSWCSVWEWGLVAAQHSHGDEPFISTKV